MEKIQIPLGFIYYLQNPKTKEIFYVGAIETSLKNRKPYGHKWEYFSDIDVEIQDIVQTTYENKR